MRFTALLMLLALPAAAHVPDLDNLERRIEDPLRSLAFYDRLDAGEHHDWTFDLAQGDVLFLQIAVPPAQAWRPEASLTGPSGPIPLDQGEGMGLEPFTPYASQEVWSLRSSAPENGRYTLTVSGSGGPYAFGYGLAESFSPTEWVGIPLQVQRIHAWAGNPWWPTVLLYAAAIGLVVAGAVRGRLPAPYLAPAAAALFAASGLDRIHHAAVAALQGAQAGAGAWILAVALAAPAFVLAWLALRARTPWALWGLAAAGFVTWAGLLLGPVLAAAAGIVRLRGVMPKH